MAGMRMGADRIAKCIMGIFNGYGLPEVMPWKAMAEQLGDDRGCILEAPPYVFNRKVGGPELLVGTWHRHLRMTVRDVDCCMVFKPCNPYF